MTTRKKWLAHDFFPPPFAFELYADVYKSSNYAMAVHEAAHAVLNEKLGYEVRRVELNGSNGVTEAKASQNLHHVITIAYAGYVASSRTIDEEYAHENSLHDYDIINGELIKIEESQWKEVCKNCKETCERLVEENWRRIQNVATVLAENKKLTGDQVRKIISDTKV
jgi:hypothetical protein